jgi:hypothetical protein
MKILLTPDGRRAGAFLAVLGGCIVMTLYAAAALTLVRGNATYALYLGLAAHLHVLLGLTGFAALWVKRSFKATRDGIEITDTTEAAQTVADAAQGKADEIKDAV